MTRSRMTLLLLTLVLLFCAAPQVMAQLITTTPIPQLNWIQRSDWVNVKDLGAVGDGTTDDTAAIQQALNQVALGSTLYFPAGDYRITQTLMLDPASLLQGVTLIGDGRDTRLTWAGPAGDAMLTVTGAGYSRYVGIVFDGQGVAGIGLHHLTRFFETQVRHQHLAFINFTDAGVLAPEIRDQAIAETDFENCYFANCNRGVAFLQWNDYNFTFDGCAFEDCGIGIQCFKGCFYARNCSFRNSSTADIDSRPEHGSSVRRCTSVGSAAFVNHNSSVGGLVIQDCHVDQWTSAAGAITYAGAPGMIFDCTFTGAPNANNPVYLPNTGQRVILANNRFESTDDILRIPAQAMVYQIDSATLAASTVFLKSQADTPSVIFDAKRDFGAVGNGVADDTAAVQAAIDAARTHGNGAMAYLPYGTYKITQTLEVHGGNYTFGGGSQRTQLLWAGAAGGTTVHVADPQNITLCYLHMEGASSNAIDIHQTSTGVDSMVTYDGVRVYGRYTYYDPFNRGLKLSNLSAGSKVLIRYAQGNLRFDNAAAATILANLTYQGSVVIEGDNANRSGFLGFLTRLDTSNDYNIYVRNNHSLVMSDYYFENSNNGLSLEGASADPDGRITIQCPKMHVKTEAGVAVDMNGYHGKVFIGPGESMLRPLAAFQQQGADAVDLFLVGNLFYKSSITVPQAQNMNLYLIGNFAAPVNYTTTSYQPWIDALPADLSVLGAAIDDLRELGKVDAQFNHAP